MTQNEDINMEERIAIRDSAKPLKKYGSTCQNSKKFESYLKHQVSETDTLQGLALKYSVSTEQIRRANRLWANDSLFLRKSLLIPVNKSIVSPAEVVLLDSNDGPSTSSYDNNNVVHQDGKRPNVDDDGSSSKSYNNNDDERRNFDYTYSDFLVRIDSAIASTRTRVLVAQDNSEFVDHDSLFSRPRGAMSRLKQQQQQQQQQAIHQEATHNGTELPKVMTQGRKVRNSLQRLEKEQDEIFEL